MKPLELIAVLAGSVGAVLIMGLAASQYFSKEESVGGVVLRNLETRKVIRDDEGRVAWIEIHREVRRE